MYCVLEHIQCLCTGVYWRTGLHQQRECTSQLDTLELCTHYSSMPTSSPSSSAPSSPSSSSPPLYPALPPLLLLFHNTFFWTMHPNVAANNVMHRSTGSSSPYALRLPTHRRGWRSELPRQPSQACDLKLPQRHAAPVLVLNGGHPVVATRSRRSAGLSPLNLHEPGIRSRTLRLTCSGPGRFLKVNAARPPKPAALFDSMPYPCPPAGWRAAAPKLDI